MPELGFGNQHAGDESAERERQAGVLGEPRESQRDEQHVQREKLVRLALGNDVKPPAQDASAADQHHGQQHGRLQQRKPKSRRQVGRLSPQRRDDYEQRNDCEILE